MKSVLKYALLGLGAIAAAFALRVAIGSFLGNDDDGKPVSTVTIDGKTIRIYAPGGAYSLSVSNEPDGAQKIEVRERTIVVTPDGRITVDGTPLAVGGFSELALVVHPDRRVETRVDKPAR
jgi:hypothetical protein